MFTAYVLRALFGWAFGYLAYEALKFLLEGVSLTWRYRRDEDKKIPYRYVYWICVLLGIVFMIQYIGPRIESAIAHLKAKQVAYEASLTRVTVTVTEVEPVVTSMHERSQIGNLIQVEEFPRQKLFVSLHNIKKISVGDLLDLQLDGWAVVKASQAETMPVPAGHD